VGRAASLVIALAALGSALDGESRRAILVGIDHYNPDATAQAQLLRVKSATVKRPVIEGDARYWRFDDLDGAVNDVSLMKAVLQSLGFQDFVVLTDRDATADAILRALQKNLVDDAQPGDLRLFYYSGHGNHVKNRASAEQQGISARADRSRSTAIRSSRCADLWRYNALISMLATQAGKHPGTQPSTSQNGSDTQADIDTKPGAGPLPPERR